MCRFSERKARSVVRIASALRLECVLERWRARLFEFAHAQEETRPRGSVAHDAEQHLERRGVRAMEVVDGHIMQARRFQKDEDEFACCGVQGLVARVDSEFAFLVLPTPGVAKKRAKRGEDLREQTHLAAQTLEKSVWIAKRVRIVAQRLTQGRRDEAIEGREREFLVIVTHAHVMRPALERREDGRGTPERRVRVRIFVLGHEPQSPLPIRLLNWWKPSLFAMSWT